MHLSNVYYGHRHVLAEYADVDPDRPLRGHLQHGASRTTGLVHPRRLVSWLPRLVWSELNRTNAVEAGIERVVQVGAPFLYLRELRGIPDLPATPSTIFYPYHSSEWDELEGSHSNVITAVLERETAPVTACLYWLEFENPVIRRSYEDAGFRVICHGRREDPGFLRRQFDELSRHSRVITNRACTAVFYGGALEREIDVYGEVFAWVGQSEIAQREQSEAFPELVDGGLDPVRAREVSDHELGAEALHDPAALRAVCGWGDHRGARAQAAAARAEHYGRAALVQVTDKVAGARSS